MLTVNPSPLPNTKTSSAGAVNGSKGFNPFQSLASSSTARNASKRSAKQTSREQNTKQRVLVVDDVNDVTEMIALFLKHAGYDVTTANSAGNALQLANERSFDLIISDIGMPEMNGYELAESLRGRSEYQHTPLIAVTGYTEYDDRGRSLRAGFDAHLTKPINPSQLLDLVSRLIG